jgi:hypothetical protein
MWVVNQKVIAIADFSDFIFEGKVYEIREIWACKCEPNFYFGHDIIMPARCATCGDSRFGKKYAPSHLFMDYFEWIKAGEGIKELF